MGVPKFFRYISERYPCLSETLKSYQIPEFDNFYLDMNGIIHGCSHPNDSDVSFRISEEEILKNIFRYIEILFHMIQPRTLLFLAIDGVAPRAKINQQRSRRFRAAKDIETQEAKALAKGIPIPEEKRFDSNCITPGTLFMSKLNEQLKYFITYKISTDKLWQRCKVIFSGSEVPGEGEHKIMDYIRYMRAQPDYDINTRHCLYGLDADLIMLGLCTHELQFTLLREEVKFGKNQKKIMTPEETKFCLLHLSLLRDYINHEFSSLKEKLCFPYDIEKIIDDWVLMGFLIGNDFIPNLPNLHIADGALSILYHVYMDVLPTLDGYINEAGTLRLDRFEKFMERLSHLDMEQFSEHYADIKYFESKTGRRPNESERHIYRKSEDTCEEVLSTKKTDDKELEALMRSAATMSVGDTEEDDAADEESDSDIYNMEFVQHKRDYYMNKLEYQNIDEEFLRSQAECYVRAIQWNLNYYYNGCCSWSWYYPHHYAPYISDIKDFKDLKLEFDLGEPFLPFEQLLATLPANSKDLLPVAFQTLLTEQQSPIIDYYPTQFKTDLNGKQNDWEAVVLLPFIKEKNLLEAMAPHYSELTSEERERHKHGPMCLYSYTEEDLGIYTAPEYFPDVKNHSHVQLINREDIIVPRDKLVKGLCPGVLLDVYYPGFPVLRYIQHTASLEMAHVRVFQFPSRKDSMILHVTPPAETDLTMVASEFLGKTVFVNWPYLTEAQVIGVSNCDTKLSLINPQMNYCYENVNEEELRSSDVAQWEGQKKHIAERYKTRLGIDVNETSILIHARPLCGSKYILGSHGKLYLEKQWSSAQETYAYQTVVKDISVHCINPTLYKTVTDIFVPGSICFMLGHPHYGALGQILKPPVCETSSRIRVSVNAVPEPPLEALKQLQTDFRTQYMHGSIAAQRLGISSHLLSRITGTIYVNQSSSGEFSQEVTKYNVGLNLKFNKQNEEVPGYTRKENGLWLYSKKAVDLVRAYMVKCPDLFERLVKNVTNGIFPVEKLFDNGSEELSNTVAWLKQQLHGMESRSCGTETLESFIVQKLEEKIDAFFEARNDAGKPVLMQVKPHLLFKPGLHLCNSPPDPNAQHHVLDRICCIKETYTVPLGYKGTIIGIQKAENPLETMYDVLFDKTFPGGFSINGCSECRGYRLSVLEFINLSYGERIEKGKFGVADTAAESADARRPASNQKTSSRASASAFASFREERNLSARNSPGSPKLRIIKKNQEDVHRNNQIALVPDSYKREQRNSHTSWREPYKSTENAHQNVLSKSIQKNQPSPVKPATEFQVLWDELHQKQKPSGIPKTALPAPQGATVKQINKDTSGTCLQDPSAFLKAMLKIPDGSVQQNTQSGLPENFPGNAISLKDNVMDAPPLVQQLFDHARQNEKVQDNKGPIWYCSQLLHYYQLRRVGMPRYTYFTDDKTNLIRAHILLPDSRIFVGDPCMTHEQASGSAAQKVYTELNSVKLRPDMKSLLPPPSQWYFSQQNKAWPQNVHPPVVPIFPPNAQGPASFPQWTPPPPPVQQNPLGFPQMAIHSNQPKMQSQPIYGEPKSEIKNSTPFVPLQAQKKSTSVAVKQSAKKTNQCAKDNLEPVVQQKKKESFSKTVKVQSATSVNEKIIPAQSNLQQLQSTQNTRKPKKSRVAAKFGIPSQTEGNHSKDST